jgi:uncharacterized phage protein (TIGR02218 family)
MRTLPTNLADQLAVGVTTLCRCWLLTRQDGVELGFTDHDRDLVIAGKTFEAASGLEASEIENAASLATGGGEIAGALSSARIEPADIEAGLYDGARLRCWLVDWQAPALDFLIDAATLGEIRRADCAFVAETRNAYHAFDQEKGRRYAATCSADLGDARCGVDVSATPHRVPTAIAATDGLATLASPGLAANPAGDFSLGRLQFTSGANAGLVVGIKEHREGGEIALWRSLARPMAVGDQIAVTAGCDKRFATCRSRFANAANFRDFPFIPSPEFVIAYARPGEGTHQGRPLVQS